MSNKHTILAAVAIAALSCVGGARVSRADAAYPYQGTQNFHVDGVVTMVDADRDRVTITASDGHVYNLDTDNTVIKLRDSSRPGDTGDLANGMHVEVNGRLLSKDIVAVDRLTVLAYNSRPSTYHDEPAPPMYRPVDRPVDMSPEPTAASAIGQKIRLRGTVENVNDADGLVVVRVNSHLRTVLVDHDTDLTDVPAVDDDHIGLRNGDRVTVSGRLRDDGTIRASALSLSRNIDTAVRDAGPVVQPVDEPSHQIVGRVSHESDKYMSRDIRVRVDSGREVTVHVGHNVRIQRDGRPISVHELQGGDVVRVIGASEDDGFHATRIDVLQQYEAE